MKRKILPLALAFVMLILCACTANPTASTGGSIPTTEPALTQTAPKPEEDPVVDGSLSSNFVRKWVVEEYCPEFTDFSRYVHLPLEEYNLTENLPLEQMLEKFGMPYDTGSYNRYRVRYISAEGEEIQIVVRHETDINHGFPISEKGKIAAYPSFTVFSSRQGVFDLLEQFFPDSQYDQKVKILTKEEAETIVPGMSLGELAQRFGVGYGATTHGALYRYLDEEPIDWEEIKGVVYLLSDGGRSP